MSEYEAKLRGQWPDWIGERSVRLAGSPGWHPIVVELLERIDAELPWGVHARFRLSLAREKLGRLQVLWKVDPWDACPREIRDRVAAHVRKAVERSAATCARCGFPGRIDERDMPLLALCEQCRDDRVAYNWNSRHAAAGDPHRIVRRGEPWSLAVDPGDGRYHDPIMFLDRDIHVAVKRADQWLEEARKDDRRPAASEGDEASELIQSDEFAELVLECLNEGIAMATRGRRERRSGQVERLARLGPTRTADRVASGFPAAVLLTPQTRRPGLKTVAAAIELARRGVTLLRAKRALEEMIERGRALVPLPMLDDEAELADALRPLGIHATLAAPLDEKARDGEGAT
jgi:hypothetical protein